MSETPHARVADRRGRGLRDLRISVTDRCNFRCPYCMPAETYGEAYRFLPKAELLTYEEISRLARLFVRLGVRKIRITGGEPLIRTGLSNLVAQLAAIEGIEDLALTTNGVLLARTAAELRQSGLRRVTVSLDSLDPEVFRRMNGDLADVDAVLAGIEAAEAAGLVPIKINCVVQAGVNDHTVVALARFCKERGYIARFIEYMDVGTLNGWRREHVLSAAAVRDLISAADPLVAASPNYPGEVARRYLYADGGGEIGLIASVTQPFCGDCTRARLSTEGKLVTCLFAPDGTDLRTLLRSGANDEEILGAIEHVWGAREDRYSELRAAGDDAAARQRIEMYQVGG